MPSEPPWHLDLLIQAQPDVTPMRGFVQTCVEKMGDVLREVLIGFAAMRRLFLLLVIESRLVHNGGVGDEVGGSFWAIRRR